MAIFQGDINPSGRLDGIARSMPPSSPRAWRFAPSESGWSECCSGPTIPRGRTTGRSDMKLRHDLFLVRNHEKPGEFWGPVGFRNYWNILKNHWIILGSSWTQIFWIVGWWIAGIRDQFWDDSKGWWTDFFWRGALSIANSENMDSYYIWQHFWDFEMLATQQWNDVVK